LRLTRVLVLRPEPGASATAERARERGLDAVAVPLFEVEPVDWQAPDPDGFDGVLLTSANAVEHGGEPLQKLRGLNAYAVGGATAEAARAAGFEVAVTGESGVDQLLGSIDGELKLLHLCGADRRVPTAPRQEITPVVVYRSRKIEAASLSGAAGSVALIHSARAGARFAQLVDDRRSIAIAAISQAAADAAADGWKSVDVAAQPTDDALLALAATLCNNPLPK
jgi:uroporphyrinogen-III synthase